MQFLEHLYGGNMRETRISRESLTASYQNQEKRKSGFQHQKERLAYLLSRFPATYASCVAVLHNLPEMNVTSLLDLGAGPGTASLAAYTLFSKLTSITCIEQDYEMSCLGQEIASFHKLPFTYLNQDLKTWHTDKKADLVMLSYVLGELDKQAQIKILEKAWHATEKALVIISPGTSHLF